VRTISTVTHFAPHEFQEKRPGSERGGRVIGAAKHAERASSAILHAAFPLHVLRTLFCLRFIRRCHCELCESKRPGFTYKLKRVITVVLGRGTFFHEELSLLVLGFQVVSLFPLERVSANSASRRVKHERSSGAFAFRCTMIVVHVSNVARSIT
jgi:hypothetical protein|tara:strand:- start:92 stop:553 length:462 start_codon:yes stop_codon:yes gene_type:complete